MKRAALATLVAYIGWIEFSVDLNYWLPAWGSALYNGYIWGQTLILTLLAALTFGSGVFLGYRALCNLFD